MEVALDFDPYSQAASFAPQQDLFIPWNGHYITPDVLFQKMEQMARSTNPTTRDKVEKLANRLVEIGKDGASADLLSFTLKDIQTLEESEHLQEWRQFQCHHKRGKKKGVTKLFHKVGTFVKEHKVAIIVGIAAVAAIATIAIAASVAAAGAAAGGIAANRASDGDKQKKSHPKPINPPKEEFPTTHVNSPTIESDMLASQNISDCEIKELGAFPVNSIALPEGRTRSPSWKNSQIPPDINPIPHGDAIRGRYYEELLQERKKQKEEKAKPREDTYAASVCFGGTINKSDLPPPFEAVRLIGTTDQPTLHLHGGINNNLRSTLEGGYCLRETMEMKYAIHPHWLHSDSIVSGLAVVGLEKLNKSPIFPAIVTLTGVAGNLLLGLPRLILEHTKVQEAIDYEVSMLSKIAQNIIDKGNPRLKQVHIPFSNGGVRNQRGPSKTVSRTSKYHHCDQYWIYRIDSQ